MIGGLGIIPRGRWGNGDSVEHRTAVHGFGEYEFQVRGNGIGDAVVRRGDREECRPFRIRTAPELMNERFFERVAVAVFGGCCKRYPVPGMGGERRMGLEAHCPVV